MPGLVELKLQQIAREKADLAEQQVQVWQMILFIKNVNNSPQFGLINSNPDLKSVLDSLSQFTQEEIEQMSPVAFKKFYLEVKGIVEILGFLFSSSAQQSQEE